MNSRKKIALAGNPNCGKTTLFNKFTGLNQKVGNFPGVTVEKKSGIVRYTDGTEIELIDLPGCYSLSSTSPDEKVVQDILLNPEHEAYPDAIIITIDVTNIKRNLFLATQIIDLGFPVVIALNMSDIASKKGLQIDLDIFQKMLGVPVMSISAKKNIGLERLRDFISKEMPAPKKNIFDVKKYVGNLLQDVCTCNDDCSLYCSFKRVNHYQHFDWITNKDDYQKIITTSGYNVNEKELFEINDRYEFINQLVAKAIINKGRESEEDKFTKKLDRIATHPFVGFFVFLAVFFLLFQAVFTIAEYPKSWIDSGMAWLTGFVGDTLPEGMLNDFITNGVLAGLSGVFVFLPPIMILFGLITILEDSGYLSRVSFMSDRMLRTFGMNGKSVVPLVGGFACAIPAIMAARSIDSRKERIITIFVTPLMSCSARLPVYIFLTAFVVPDDTVLGFISLQGLFMMGLYLTGVFFSLIVALILNKIIKNEGKSTFIMELPKYAVPEVKNVLTSMFNKGKTFLLEAGKIILITSVIIWILSTFGPSNEMQAIEEKYQDENLVAQYNEEELNQLKDAEVLEHSYIGHIGKFIEPAIEPLGFDWKIGIAMISSFSAREIFPGTMNALYSIEGGNGKISNITFSIPTALSMLVFFIFAMQCFSTVAIVIQETGTWKFAILQFFIYTGIAYLGSLTVYQLFS